MFELTIVSIDTKKQKMYNYKKVFWRRKMAVFTIADLNILIQNKCKYTDIVCKDYLCKQANPKIDFCVSGTQEDYIKDKAILPDADDGYLESLSIYRQIARKMLDYNGIVLHSSVVEMNDVAYAFAAKSGTGKSTHSKLWVDNFKGKAKIINGDKPLLRFIDGKFYVYGTPWCGKEGYNINTKAVLKKICFLERCEQNSITRISKDDALKRIFGQLLLPENTNQAQNFFVLLDNIIQNIDFYLLKCNTDISAAQICYDGMNTL